MHAPAAPPKAPAHSVPVRAARLWLLPLQGRLRQGVRAPVPDASGPSREAPVAATASRPRLRPPPVRVGARTRAAG
eukprot:4642769-Pleurochrysis_carterae.AAC.1